MKKAALYVRVSSKEQAQEGYSIPAQRKFLQDYATQNGLEIVREFEEVETAKRAGRSQFGEMLKFFKRNKSIKHLLVEKTDRLYRNFADLLKIDELQLTIHFAKEGHQLSPDSRSGDKLIHNIKVAIAKNYVDNLGEETSKGLLEKARQGLWPSVAPLGYDNNRETKLIDVDPHRGPIIRELFETYATGRHSVQDLVPIAWDLGLRSRKGCKVHKAALHKMLLNPIYMGEFIWKRERFQGRHEPLVNRELWDEVQRVIHSRNRPRPRRLQFAFRGLLKCGHCGCSITGQIQKGKYVYYRCTRSRGNCQEMPIREEELAEQLGEPLKWLRLTPERLQWVVEALKECHEQEQALTASEQERINHDVMIVRKKIDTLYEDRLKGLVPDEFWQRKFAEYQAEESRLLSRIERLQAAKGSTIEEGERILKLSQRAYSLYVTQNPDEQRKLADILLSNCTLKDRRVSVTLRKPFDVIADSVKEEEQLRSAKLPFSAANGNWLPKRNSSRYRRRPGWAKPEVWFRIVHIAQEGADRAPVAAYREQTVEIALGPKGAFQTGIMGALKRRVAPDQTVNALSAKARNRRPPKAPQTPKVVELLRTAQEWRRQIDTGDVTNQAQIARREGITRARVTQVMGLLRLTPEIQECVLSLPDTVGRPKLTEHVLRPIARLKSRSEQNTRFRDLVQPSE